MAPAIVLSPTSGPIGTSVHITGSGFTALDAITFKYAGSSISATDGPITADVTGAFSAHITVPASVAGGHTVEADDAHSGSATATFTVTASIAITPASGIVGATIGISGSGFAATSVVTFTFGGASLTTSPGTVTTDGSGNIPAGVTFAVPASVQGTHAVVGTDASSNSGSANFSTTPSITIDPTTGPEGTGIVITGTGFAGTSAITIKVNGTTVTTDPASVTSGATGGFSGVEITMPNANPGSQTVSATDASSNSASATFTSTGLLSMSHYNKYDANDGAAISVVDDAYQNMIVIDVREYKDITLLLQNTGTNGLTWSIYGIIHEADNNIPPTDDEGILAWYPIATGQSLASAAAAVEEALTDIEYSYLLLQAKRTSAGQSTTAILSAKAIFK